MSYANALLYSAVIPVYHSRSDRRKDGGRTVRADDPSNRDEVAAMIARMV